MAFGDVRMNRFARWESTTVKILGSVEVLFAIILMYLSFRWTGKPIMGFPEVGVTDLASLLEWCKSLIIPIIVIGTGNTCSLIRTVRAQMLDEQQLPSGS